MSVSSQSSRPEPDYMPEGDKVLLEEYNNQLAKILALEDVDITPPLSLDNLSQWRAEQNAKYEAVRHEREELVKKFWEWRERHKEFINRHFGWTKEMKENYERCVEEFVDM